MNIDTRIKPDRVSHVTIRITSDKYTGSYATTFNPNQAEVAIRRACRAMKIDRAKVSKIDIIWRDDAGMICKPENK